MGRKRFIAGVIAGGLIAAAIVAPAIGASQQARPLARTEAKAKGALGQFTPASADPKLAALIARAGLDDENFRFTPAEARRADNRSITVAVRARSSLAARQANDRLAEAGDASVVGLKPIAYNLGVAVGWRRFAVSGDVSRLDLANVPGSHEAADVGVTYAGKRFSGKVVATAERPVGDAPRLTSDNVSSYSVELGGSYALTRRLDVTAGVRYKTENYRLDRLTDNRRDSQAVYIGTALRF